MGFDWEYYLGESYDSFDLGRAYEDAVFDACDAMRRYETPQEEWFARPKENACFGIWYGHEVCYGGVWGGHTFTREERNRLECCEPIKFDYKTKKGKKRTVVGRLKETAYKGQNMTVLEIVLIGMALAMDACAVAMTNGMTNAKMRPAGHNPTGRKKIGNYFLICTACRYIGGRDLPHTNRGFF